MQRPAHRLRFSILAALVFTAACVTVNIYFPAAKVEKTAEKIVEEVYQEKTETPPPEKEKPRSSLGGASSAFSPGLPGWGPRRPTPKKPRP